jgi:hypothetical protein
MPLVESCTQRVRGGGGGAIGAKAQRLTCRLARSCWKWGIGLEPADDRDGPRDETGSSDGRFGSPSCVNKYDTTSSYIFRG